MNRLHDYLITKSTWQHTSRMLKFLIFIYFYSTKDKANKYYCKAGKIICFKQI